MRALGDFIGGRFVSPQGEALTSHNPARGGEVVLETAWDASRADDACAAAAAAEGAWRALSMDARWAFLERFRQAIEADADRLSEAITLEMGKLRSEARIEVRALVGRFNLVHGQVLEDLVGGPVPGFPDEVLYHKPHGVVGVIGPFNFPLHLCHAHVIPALLTGNAVVIKPSDITPLCGQRYAEAAQKAGFPPGVFNVVLGKGAAGAAIAANANVKGLCFTGSWAVGRRILGASLDRPEMLVALEMGGKNTSIVLDDADIRHAAHDIAIGGYLTTGQRCTCTDRVLVQRSVAPAFLDALRPLVESVRFGDPEDEGNFAGPMATEASLARFESALEAARSAGAQALVPGGRIEGGAFARASLHLLPEGVHCVSGYTDEELFGPDLGVEIVEDLEEAVAVMKGGPYGLANSIFTRSEARFERLYQDNDSGLLNWNRTTNQASPRLPFGGVGQSGNFRPAGAYAARNTVYPVSSRQGLPGDFEAHPKLRAHLVAPDLDALESQHAAQEALAAERDLLTHPRPMAVRRPKGGALPKSSHWLRRLYARGRMAKEKKPGVFDHLRSVGPWMVSVDDAPLSTIDAMSQTATVCAGFAEDAVVDAYTRGAFHGTSTRAGDTALGPHPAAEAFAEVLRGQLPALPHVSFVNSGAEANEKAFALCRLNNPRPDADRVLVFEGSFHGRTLLALHSTWNPVKREPFQIAGYESSFAPFPLWTTPMEAEPETPAGWLEAAARGDVDAMALLLGGDGLLMAELASLRAVDEALASGRIFACSIEPMQSEGGDRYATARFYKALRLLTRHHEVPLIFDEVQCGFGLGGPFFWFTEFGLVDKQGQPDWPDAVVVAKRAQVGLCMSRWEDPEPSSAHPASLVRGRIHAEMMIEGASESARIHALVWPRLMDIARRYPQFVNNPRGRGFAFAFDLPSPQLLFPYYSQRFWRGAVVFGAGDRTVRYRLSSAFSEADIDIVFESMRRSLSWIDAHPGQRPPAWMDAPPRPERGDTPVNLRVPGPEEADALIPRIMALEAKIFEPARRDPEDRLRLAFEDPDGVPVVAEVDGQLMGYSVAAPLERIAGKDGIVDDPMNGLGNTLHSIALSVAPEAQGMGLGERLKAAQLRRAEEMRGEDGAARYKYITGRNRVGYTDAMMRLNRKLGGHTVQVLTGQYGEEGGEAIYYRIPVRRHGPDVDLLPAAPVGGGLAGGISDPLSAPPASLLALEDAGALQGPTVTKITICNYITPAVVRAIEWATALAPSFPHVYLTSGRDEGADKAVRTLRWHRKAAQVCIGFEGAYFGHTSSGARSLSDPGVHAQGPAYFDWPLVPHPSDVGEEAALEALRAAIAAAGGADAVLGIFAEPVQERTGRVLSHGFLRELDCLRAGTSIPIVFSETASAAYRSGVGPFASSGLPMEADIMMWWGGGQTGFVHLKPHCFISKPLMMVSTWDGDELSMIRLHHQLRAIRGLDLSAGIAAMERVDAAAQALGLASRGQGLYRVLEAGRRAPQIQAAGAGLRDFGGGRLGVIPCLDTAAPDLDALVTILDGLGGAQ